MPDEEKSRELTRSNFAAQMAMLGYEPDGNPKNMVEVVRCIDCKHWKSTVDSHPERGICKMSHMFHWGGWFCADGERIEENG